MPYTNIWGGKALCWLELLLENGAIKSLPNVVYENYLPLWFLYDRRCDAKYLYPIGRCVFMNVCVLEEQWGALQTLTKLEEPHAAVNNGAKQQQQQQLPRPINQR